MDLTTRISELAPTQSHAGLSFEADLRSLLWQRAMYVMLLGLGVSAFLSVFFVFIMNYRAQLENSVSRHISLLYHGHALSFLTGAVLLFFLRRKFNNQGIRVLVFLIVVLNICLDFFTQSVGDPGHQNFLGLSMLIFMTAAFMPWRTRFQVTLCALSLTAFISCHFLTRALIPEVAAFWQSMEDGFFDFQGSILTGLAIIGALSFLSVKISHTLYHLHKTAHKAEHLGNYSIKEEIGRGGMGRVLLAQHALICRPTAVKVLDARSGQVAANQSRFEREVNLSAGLSHPNTIQIYDFGHTGDGTFYYAMEYLQGMDLGKLVERFGPLPAERVVYILTQVCGSLSEAHARNIVHRDIKPANLFLTMRGGIPDFVKVLDFGLATQVRGDIAEGLSQTGIVLGTPRYISPEAIYGNVELDGRADIYNLGGVAYWLLTGHPPFEAESGIELIIQHVKSEPMPPSSLSEMPIPRELEDIVLKCLAKKPEERYQSTEELENALCSIEFATPWTRHQAREWWNLHGMNDEVCWCE